MHLTEKQQGNLKEREKSQEEEILKKQNSSIFSYLKKVHS